MLGDRRRPVDDPPVGVRRDQAAAAVAELEGDRCRVLLQQADHELQLGAQVGAARICGGRLVSFTGPTAIWANRGEFGTVPCTSPSWLP